MCEAARRAAPHLIQELVAKVPDTALAQSAPGAAIESRQQLLYPEWFLFLSEHEQAAELGPCTDPLARPKYLRNSTT